MAIRFTSLHAATSILALAGALSAASPVIAQDKGKQQDATAQPDQEVVVTAQFRAQRLQDTPLAITAVTSQQLEAKSQNDLATVADALLASRQCADGKEERSDEREANHRRSIARSLAQRKPTSAERSSGGAASKAVTRW